MKRTAQISQWLARILSGMILLFVCFVVTAYFLGGKEHSARPLAMYDYVVIATSAVLLVGLGIAWKWEFVGGTMTLAACLIFAIVNPQVLAFPGTLIPITALLFLTSWWMRSKLQSNTGRSDSTS